MLKTSLESLRNKTSSIQKREKKLISGNQIHAICTNMGKELGNLQNSDLELVKACRKKDANAQRFLYEKYKAPMFRICLRYANDRAEAEDILQEGFIKVYRDLHQYSGSGPLAAWMRKIMVNSALQQIRKRKKLFPSIDISQLSHDFQTKEDIHATINAKALTRIVQTLPDGYRAVFNMYVIEGYSHKEIAEKLNINISTSKSQLFKAKAALRVILERKMAL